LNDSQTDPANSNPSLAFQSRVATSVNSLQRMNEKTESLLSDTDSSKREIWRIRVKEQGAEVTSLVASLERFVSKEHKRAVEQMEREELLQRRNRTRGEDALNVGVVRERESLQRSHAQMDDNISIAEAVLNNIMSQGQSLRGANDKIYSVAESLGLSSTMLNWIARRDWEDSWLIILMIIFSVIIMSLIWWFLA